jgi:hypothetical protein
MYLAVFPRGYNASNRKEYVRAAMFNDIKDLAALTPANPNSLIIYSIFNIYIYTPHEAPLYEG